jgi:REP-associated tyrosine transposase
VAQSLSKVLLHLVFSTKNRRDWIPEPTLSAPHAYLANTCRALGSEAFRVGGTRDHVHIACILTRTLTIAKLHGEIKSSSSAWMKKQDGVDAQFAWQGGYGAFSLGQSQLPSLLSYVENQMDHHRTRTFKEEFLALLNRYGIDYDERYLWD